MIIQFKIVGVYSKEVPPVPIPNTEVKLFRVEDTWLATTRENKSMPALFMTHFMCHMYAPLAQSVEQLTLNQWVLGSSPRWCTFLYLTELKASVLELADRHV